MKKRYIEFDLMRILACFCVIMIHVGVFQQADKFEVNTLAHQAYSIYGVLSRWAVPAFVMLSGMMILPKGDETSIWRLMIHRAGRMVITFIAWSAVYAFYNVFVLGKVYASTALITWLDGCFSGEIHMWYLLMLAALYLASPLLTVLIKNLNKKWTVYWILIMFLFSSVIPFIVKLNIPIVSTIVSSFNGYMEPSFFCGWTIYFVLGYYIGVHHFLKREKIAVYVFGGVALAFSLYATVVYSIQHGTAMGVLPYEYPNIVLMGIAAVVFFKEEVPKCKKLIKNEEPIYHLSQLTFGIFLIHVLLLKIWYSVGMNTLMFHPIFSIPVVAAVVFVSSGVIIWLIRKIPVVGKYIA